ncbi:unnamed protein product [Lactuca saligna]|uniref:Uncharacterized protein n=1 Tax=Lactuca saligna TaxID=75948 RepID=A0AA35ZUG6_LACSI|nr:unnamed protein product [Lactuca saligna]
MKERHVLFVKDVKTVREDVNRKLEDLKVNVAKGINELNITYSSLLSKVDIIVEALTKVVQWYQSLLPKFDGKATVGLNNCGKIDTLLRELNELISKYSSFSLLTPEFLTQKFCVFETTIQQDLAPLSHLISLLLTNTPHVVIGVHGGERRLFGKGEGAHGKTDEEVKVVVMVFTTHNCDNRQN